MLDVNHQLFKLSESIDWFSLEKDITNLLGGDYESQWRLVSATVYLMSFYDLSSAEVIDKWSECPYHHFFCSGEAFRDVSVENEDFFPISQQVLDRLSIGLMGEGYEAMIRALLSNPQTSLEPSLTVH